MCECRKTQSCTKIVDRDGDMASSIGNRACNEVYGGVVGTRVIELTYLFGVVEHWDVCKSVSQTATCEEVRKILKYFICWLILEG